MLAIIKYNAGNVQSVIYALNRLGVEPVLTDDPELLRSAEKIIFPGVGEASSTMRFLRQKGLDRLIPSLTQPLLGVCLGMQLMCRHSEEGNVDCLGIFDHEVRKFSNTYDGKRYKVPHMGWNKLTDIKGPLFQDLPADPFVYFVHSFFVEKGPHTIATTDYGLPFSSALHKDNFYAVQFHPEKSSEVGAKILENFLRL